MAKKNKKPSRQLQQVVHAMQPQEFNRLGEVGLGQVLDVGPGDLTEQVLLWEFEHDTFPLTTSRFNQLVNSERNVLGCSDTDTDDTDCTVRRSPYLNCGTGFNCPFLMTRLCVVAVADGEQFSVRGVYNPAQPGANSEIPQVPPYDLDSGDSVHSNGLWGLTPNLSGIVGSGGFGHATLGWGWPVLRFLEQWMMSTRLQVVVCNKLVVVDDLLATLGMCMMAPTYKGAGMAGLFTGPYIRCVNEAMADKDLGVFITVNVTDDEATTVCLPQPVATYMKGATEFPGVDQKGAYRFDPGLFLSPFMGASFNFVNSMDEDCICPLESTSTVTTQSPHPNYLQDVSNITASCGNDTFVPGGQMEIGVVVDGFEMSAMAVAAWIARMAEGYGTTAGIKPREARMLGQLQIIHEMQRDPKGYAYLRDVVEHARARSRDQNFPRARRESAGRIAGELAGFLEGNGPQ
jgi:hypothetical protein